jgi:hypothetical protein
VEGADAWKARMTQTKNGSADKQFWYYSECLKALAHGWSNPILDCFASAVRELSEQVNLEEKR